LIFLARSRAWSVSADLIYGCIVLFFAAAVFSFVFSPTALSLQGCGEEGYVVL
jgi:hypothetical protein